MSKGSPRVVFRIPTRLLQEMDAAIDRINAGRVEELYTRSSFLVVALRERLDKIERGRRKRSKAAELPGPGPELPELHDQAGDLPEGEGVGQDEG